MFKVTRFAGFRAFSTVSSRVAFAYGSSKRYDVGYKVNHCNAQLTALALKLQTRNTDDVLMQLFQAQHSVWRLAHLRDQPVERLEPIWEYMFRVTYYLMDLVYMTYSKPPPLQVIGEQNDAARKQILALDPVPELCKQIDQIAFSNTALTRIYSKAGAVRPAARLVAIAYQSLSVPWIAVARNFVEMTNNVSQYHCQVLQGIDQPREQVPVDFSALAPRILELECNVE
jgi:hypothetical protein